MLVVPIKAHIRFMLLELGGWTFDLLARRTLSLFARALRGFVLK